MGQYGNQLRHPSCFTQVHPSVQKLTAKEVIPPIHSEENSSKRSPSIPQKNPKEVKKYQKIKIPGTMIREELPMISRIERNRTITKSPKIAKGSKELAVQSSSTENRTKFKTP